MAGRKPGPTPHSAEVIELHGNPSKLSKQEISDRRAREVKPRPIAPKVPPDLHPYARECWEQHARELQALGLLTVLDSASFRLLCEWYAIALEALEALRRRKRDGTVDQRTRRYDVIQADPSHSGVLRRHPALLVLKQATAEYRGLCREFGLTPSSRVGLRPAAPPPGLEEGGGDGDDDRAAGDFAF